MAVKQRTPRRNLLLGQIALRTRELQAEELSEALLVQETLQQDGISVLLGKICIDKGFLSRNALAHLIATQQAGESTPRDHLFVNIALSNDLVGRVEVKKALDLQRQYRATRGTAPPPIGRILIKRELLSGQQVRAVLAAQQRLKSDGATVAPGSGHYRALLWYVAGSERHGPLTDRELTALVRSGTARDDDLVWREGLDDWVLLTSLSDFEDRQREIGAS